MLQWGLTVLAALILALLGYFFIRLIGAVPDRVQHVRASASSSATTGTSRATSTTARALVVGTLITSAIALIIGVPVAVATALFITELCPRRLAAPLSILVDLLAAVPSVVYGLWGVFVLIPKLLPARSGSRARSRSSRGSAAGTVTGPNYFIAGLILAIMILPIVSAISREVIATVPSEHKEAALALGATRWEMIRMAVLPYSRPGITGGAMLGLGRAIGETIAVVLVIGNAPTIGQHLFNQGYTLAAVIANEFGEAATVPIHSSALFAAGLVLFVLTLIVNIIARWFVVARRSAARGAGGDAGLTDRRRRGGWVTANERARGFPQISARRRRTDRVMRGVLLAATRDRAGAARADHLLPAPQGARGVERELLHDRPERQLLRQSRRDPQRDPRHARDRRAGDADLGPDRDRRRPVPDRVRQAVAGSPNIVRYFVDVMTGVPSIMFGLFIYIVLVISHVGGSGSPAGRARSRSRC